MTEEINNINTDLKELFIESNYDKLKEVLDEIADDIVLEITLYNYTIIKKYYDSEKYNLLVQYIKFTAYTSYLCEYAAKRQLISGSENEKITELFTNIYDLIKSGKSF